MKIYRYDKLNTTELQQLCSRSFVLSQDVIDVVTEIENKVLQQSDEALRELTEKFDGPRLKTFKISEKELAQSEDEVADELKEAIKTAKQNIWKFHAQQLECRKVTKLETSKGIFCWQEFKPIEKVGLYIPGGSAPLFSTVLMLAIPAMIAGCKRIVICTPPDREGRVAPEIIWTAKYLGITEIYKLGGAQAVFALSYGTKQIPKVDKIFGPGNQYVTAAKLKAVTKVAIDMPAGPSEALIIADKNANAKFIAADLLAQAEHDINAQVVLLCDDNEKLNKIIEETKRQLKTLPKASIANGALKNSFALLVPDIATAIQFSNLYAPEHLLLAISDYQQLLPQVQNAGSVFCGPYASVAFGDYASGTNHVLPTSGFAKSYSGLSVNNYGKWVTFQSVTKEGVEDLGHIVEVMAAHEQLFAHKAAVSVRRSKKIEDWSKRA